MAIKLLLVFRREKRDEEGSRGEERA